MDRYEEDLEDEVNDIISQIKNQGKPINLHKIEKEYPELSADQVDAFVLKYASKVIIDLASALGEQSEIVKDGGTSQDVIALSELARAFQGNIEILQKRKIADNKNISQKEIKQMEIDSRSSDLLLGNGAPGQAGIFASREEIIKGMATVLLENTMKKEAPVDPDPPIDV